MAQKVASLYAEIGANTTTLQQGLAGAKKAITRTGTSFESLKTGIVKGAAGAGMAALALKGAFDQTAGAAVAYAAQVRDLNRVTGAGAEETSRLIQVADDLTISYGDLEQAARIASKNGIEFTTESLGRLSDQYLTLNPGQERAAFLIETFGKSGLEMGKMMEVGADGIASMSAAIDDNMIMTEGAVQAARDFEIAQDALSDAVTGVKYSIGNALIPVLTKAATAFTTLTTASSKLGGVFEQHEQDMRTAVQTWEEYATEIIRAGLVAGQFKGSQEDLAAAIDRGTISLEGNEDRVNGLMTAVGGLTDAEWGNVESTEALGDAAAATGEALEMDLGASILTASNAMRDLTTELLYNVASQGLDEDAAISLARSMGLLDEGTYAALNATEQLRAKYEEGLITLAQYEAGILAIGGAWNLVPATAETVYTVTVRGDPIPDFGLTDPDAPIIPGDDDIGPGGGVPGGGPQAQGNTYNVVINSGASANAVAERLSVLEAFGV